MTRESKEEMGQRIKEEIKEKFGTIKAINDKIEEKNLGNYTGKNPREPRAGILIKLEKAGLDINYILAGKKENDLLKEIEDLKNEVKDLKSKLYDKMVAE